MPDTVCEEGLAQVRRYRTPPKENYSYQGIVFGSQAFGIRNLADANFCFTTIPVISHKSVHNN